MSLPSSTTVLVVGAGPAGMACALSLRLSGVRDLVIVEAAEHSNGNVASRAIVIHAATLEALDLIGSADALVERGVKHSTMNYYDRSYTRLLGVDFNGLIGKTRFPFCLNLPQHITESILTQKLKDAGVSIFRPYKVAGMQENSKDSRLVDVSFENGQSITAQYVVGADGSQSAVRQLSGIRFADPGAAPDKAEESNTMAQMVIADITFSGPPFSPDSFFCVPSRESFMVLAPLQYPSENGNHAEGKIVYRLACGVPLSDGEPPSKADVAYCQQLIEKYGPYDLSSDKKNPHAVSVTDVLWSTRFRTRYSAAETFFKHFGSSTASVCLVGDAAHIHPPAGGQGMNLGLRDGISLGPVIAAALTAGPTPESDEKVRAHMALRRERAIKVIGITKAMASALGMSPGIQAKFAWSPIHIYTIRDWALWALNQSSWVRETLAYKFSGLEDRC